MTTSLVAKTCFNSSLFEYTSVQYLGKRFKKMTENEKVAYSEYGWWREGLNAVETNSRLWRQTLVSRYNLLNLSTLEAHREYLYVYEIVGFYRFVSFGDKTLIEKNILLMNKGNLLQPASREFYKN